jgi:tetratricopeptide (TPR) repeat protein
VPASAARREILFTPVDSLFGLYRVRQLMGSWPFQPPGTFDRSMDTVQARTRIEEIALDLYRGKVNWHDATAALRDYYTAEGQYHQALQAALTLIQQYPFVPGAYAAAGEILLRQRRYDEALAYFGATNDLEENAMVHMMIGSIHLAKQDFGDAIEHLERALVLDPQQVRALYQLSRAYQADGQPERAQATWTRLLKVASETEEGRQLLSTITQHGTS